MPFQSIWDAIQANTTLWVQIPVAIAALSVTAASVAFAVSTSRRERNARLVEIGVSILRSDPDKEPSIASAREWALDLIDANAGGVKFTQRARKDLLENALFTEAQFAAEVDVLGQKVEKLTKLLESKKNT